MSRHVSIRLPDDLYEDLVTAAEADDRPLSNYIVRLLQGRVPLSPEDEEGITELLSPSHKTAHQRTEEHKAADKVKLPVYKSAPKNKAEERERARLRAVAEGTAH